MSLWVFAHGPGSMSICWWCRRQEHMLMVPAAWEYARGHAYAHGTNTMSICSGIRARRLEKQIGVGAWPNQWRTHVYRRTPHFGFVKAGKGVLAAKSTRSKLTSWYTHFEVAVCLAFPNDPAIQLEACHVGLCTLYNIYYICRERGRLILNQYEYVCI